MQKTVICLTCGGQSAEHEVSLQSAKNVLEVINREVYDVIIVGIAKNGVWQYYPDGEFLVNGDDPAKIALASGGIPSFPMLSEQGPALIEAASGTVHPFNLMFPVLHGTNGEDGAIQGLCRMLNCPCVGCTQTSSANCMDKDMTKRLLTGAGIRCARGISLRQNVDELDTAAVVKQLGLPLFVKPARTGSSVGVKKVTEAAALAAAVAEAYRFDTKVLIEEYIQGREIECAILGNNELFAAVPGEVIPTVEFYSYEAKYILDDGAVLKAPADLTAEQMAQVQAIAKRAFSVMECSGMSRVDFFLTPSGDWILNEINTIPGFTKISMYPKLMQLSGISYRDLVERLIKLALEMPPVFF